MEIITKIVVAVIVLGMAGIGIFLGWRVLGLIKRVKQLQLDRNELIEQRGKQSDKLRQKGIEIDELKKELNKYSDVEPKVALTSEEKRMILNALDSPKYKARVEDPKTRHFIRVIYKGLKEKIKESIKE